MSKQKDVDKRIERLEGLLKAAKKEKKQKAVAIKKKETKEQNKKDILIGIFLRTHFKKQYDGYTKSPDFDKFLTRDYERTLFGLPPLTPQGKASPEDTEVTENSGSKETTESTTVGVEPEIEDKTESKAEISENEREDVIQEKEEVKVVPGGKEYLNVLKRCREVAKRVTKELGVIAKWDNTAKKWSVPAGTDPKIIACTEYAAEKASKIDPDPKNYKDAFEPPESFWNEFYREFPGYPDLK